MRKFKYQKTADGRQILDCASGRFIVDDVGRFIEELSAITEQKVFITNDETLKSSTAKVILIKDNLVKWVNEDRNYTVIKVEEEMFNPCDLFEVVSDFIATQLAKSEITLFEEKQ